jgi:AcrR family transcriptional regulator
MAAPNAPRVRADATRNRELILAAAAERLARDPSASLEDVVRASGLARATVYRNFPNRAALVDAVVDRALTLGADLLARSRPEDDDALTAMMRLSRAACAAGPEALVLLSLLLAGSTTVPDVISSSNGVLIDRLVLDLVRRGQAAGQFRDDVPATWLADQWFSLLQSAITHPLDDGRDAAELVIAVFRDGACAAD